MTVGFMEKIYKAHKEKKTIKHGEYEYAIEYHPMAYNPTWIIRRRIYKNKLAPTGTVYEEWEFYTPLVLAVGMW